MGVDLIKVLKGAEQQAAQLIKEAEAEGRHRLEEAEAEASSILAQLKERLKSRRDEELNQTRLKAEAEAKRLEQGLAKSLKELQQRASSRWTRAVELVREQILAQWQ